MKNITTMGTTIANIGIHISPLYIILTLILTEVSKKSNNFREKIGEDLSKGPEKLYVHASDSAGSQPDNIAHLSALYIISQNIFIFFN
jgi:hypothetical protein